jgi:hypothetical protein
MQMANPPLNTNQIKSGWEISIAAAPVLRDRAGNDATMVEASPAIIFNRYNQKCIIERVAYS